MYTCDVAGWNIIDYITTDNFGAGNVINRGTSEETIDLVISGLIHVGMKRSNAKSLVAKMCKDKYYDDAQKLFEACFPHIK